MNCERTSLGLYVAVRKTEAFLEERAHRVPSPALSFYGNP